MRSGQLAEIAVHRFSMAALGFHLDRQMLDAEFGGHSEPNRCQQLIG